MATIAPGPHHVHKAYIVFKSVEYFKQLLVPLMASLFPLLQLDDSLLPVPILITLVIAVFVAIDVALSIISYQRFTWELTASELHIKKGIFNKKHEHIPFARVYAVNATASVLERLLGLVTLAVDTASGKQGGGHIKALTLGEYEALRSEIFDRKRRLAGEGGDEGVGVEESDADGRTGIAPATENLRGVFGGDFSDEAVIGFERTLTGKQLLLKGLSGSNSLVPILVAVGFVSEFTKYLPVSIKQQVTDAIELAGAQLLAAGVIFVIAVLVFALLVSWVFGVLSSTLRYGGFVVRRRGERVEVERGLLSRYSSGVAVERVQAVRIRQGFLSHLIGYAEVSFITASEGNHGADAMAGSLVVHPFIPLRDSRTFIDELLPGYEMAPEKLESLPPAAGRRAFNRFVLWPGLVFVAVLLGVLFVSSASMSSIAFRLAESVVVAALIVYLVLASIYALLWYRRGGYAHDADYIVLQHGGWGATRTIAPRKRIQWVQTGETPFQKRVEVATIKIALLASPLGVRVSLRDIPVDRADRILDWVRLHGPSDISR